MSVISQAQRKSLTGIMGLLAIFTALIVIGYTNHVLAFFIHGLLAGIFVFVLLVLSNRLLCGLSPNKTNLWSIVAFMLAVAIVGGTFYLTTPRSYLSSLSLYTAAGKLVISLFLTSAVGLPAVGWVLLLLAQSHARRSSS